jgi:hypothetical protein
MDWYRIRDLTALVGERYICMAKPQELQCITGRLEVLVLVSWSILSPTESTGSA